MIRPRARAAFALLLAPIACSWTSSGRGGPLGSSAAGGGLVEAASEDGGVEAKDSGAGAKDSSGDADVGRWVDASGPGAASGPGGCTSAGCPEDARAPADASGADADADGVAEGVDAGAQGHAVGGTLAGLAPGAALVLRENGGDELRLTANGPFVFPAALATGAAYDVTVLAPPQGEACTVADGTGVIGSADVTGVAVTCTLKTFTIGGRLSGHPPLAALVLEDNGGDDLTLTANGAFTFALPVPYGGTYDVTLLAQPPGARCTVSNGTGTPTENVTDVAVTCEASGH